MKLTIETAENGYIVTELHNRHPEDNRTVLVLDDDFADLLHLVLESFGKAGGRHDEERIYIIKAPGDKHLDFKDYHAKAIWGED